MNKLIYIFAASLFATSATANEPLQAVDPQKISEMNRAKIEETLGPPLSAKEEDGEQILEYIIDQGGIAGYVKYTIILKDDKVIRLVKAPTDVKFNAELTQEEINHANQNTKINDIMRRDSSF